MKKLVLVLSVVSILFIGCSGTVNTLTPATPETLTSLKMEHLSQIYKFNFTTLTWAWDSGNALPQRNVNWKVISNVKVKTNSDGSVKGLNVYYSKDNITFTGPIAIMAGSFNGTNYEYYYNINMSDTTNVKYIKLNGSLTFEDGSIISYNNSCGPWTLP